MNFSDILAKDIENLNPPKKQQCTNTNEFEQKWSDFCQTLLLILITIFFIIIDFEIEKFTFIAKDETEKSKRKKCKNLKNFNFNERLIICHLNVSQNISKII